MRRLFAEEFLVPLLEPERPEPELRYDEARGLHVLPDGRPFIEVGCAASTETMTEVRAEQDDFDRPDEGDVWFAALETVTKVKDEADDFAATTLALETETRIPGERDDFARDEDPFEDERVARAERVGGTQTFVRREKDDFAAVESWAETKTAVKGEADDFHSEPEMEHASVEAAVALS